MTTLNLGMNLPKRASNPFSRNPKPASKSL